MFYFCGLRTFFNVKDGYFAKFASFQFSNLEDILEYDLKNHFVSNKNVFKAI